MPLRKRAPTRFTNLISTIMPISFSTMSYARSMFMGSPRSFSVIIRTTINPSGMTESAIALRTKSSKLVLLFLVKRGATFRHRKDRARVIAMPIRTSTKSDPRFILSTVAKAELWGAWCWLARTASLNGAEAPGSGCSRAWRPPPWL